MVAWNCQYTNDAGSVATPAQQWRCSRTLRRGVHSYAYNASIPSFPEENTAQTEGSGSRIRAYYYSLRYYQPDIGCWCNRDPAGEERGGVNLFEFARNSAVNHRDARGLSINNPPGSVTMGCCGGQIYDLNSQCCYRGQDNRSRVGEKRLATRVERCRKSSPDTPHVYLKVDNTKCGFYLRCFFEDTCGWFRALFPGPGIVGCYESGGTCNWVEVNECDVDPNCFKNCVLTRLVAGPYGTYWIFGHECNWWARKNISDCEGTCRRNR